MRPFPSFSLGLLAVSASALLPSALHAQALGRLGRPTGPSAPAQSAPQQSAPAQSAPSYQPSYPQNAPQQYSPPQYIPQQYTPSRGAPIFNRQVEPNRAPVITQIPSRGPVFTTPSYPVPSRGPVYTSPTSPMQNGGSYGRPGRGYSPPSYPSYDQSFPNNGNAPAFYGRNDAPRHRSVRVTTPSGPLPLYNGGYYPIYNNGPGYNYNNGYGGSYGYGGYGTGVTVVGGPSLLGGYYYGNYCDVSFGVNTYPSVYSAYAGFPTYIYSPATVIVLSEPYAPVYVTGYQPFYTPSYPVIYNQNTYYVGSEERAQQIVGDDESARKAALRNAYPEGSYQAAFGDIERAWLDGNVSGLQKHLRGSDVKLSVFFKGKYSYSIATGDYVQITHDAFDKISTVSFKFNRLRKAKNGDVTAFGTHVYRGTSPNADPNTDGTVPFSTDKSGVTYDNASASAPGEDKTINVAYTLRRQGGQWSIVAIDSTPAAGAK